MNKHTPGPFFTTCPHGGTIYVEARLRGSTIQEVAAVGPTETPEQQQANAKLFTAAPDLLADLIVAAGTLRHYEELHRAKGTAESTEKAEVNAGLASRFEQTIAKATQ